MKNRQGFTTVELLVCFILVTTIAIAMFDVIMNYRNRQQVESLNAQMETYQYSVTKAIQDDIVRHGGIQDATIDSQYVKIFFGDGFSTELTYQNNVSDGILLESVLTYNGIRYSTKDIPDFQFDLNNDASVGNTVVNTGCQGGYFKLKIPFYHPDLLTGMGISIVVPCSG